MNTLNLLGMRCPIPLMKTQRYCRKNDLTIGDRFEVITDDPESLRDFKAFFESAKYYSLIIIKESSRSYAFTIEKIAVVESV